jgi:catecholate siderophore receptor
LKNVPGITLNSGEGAARGDSVNLRGFSAFNDFFLDGIRDAGVYTRDSFDLDSVEVVKGPSAVLFGRGSTGGAINQVTKAPVRVPFYSVTSELGTNDLYRATADLDAPIGVSAAARLNAMVESSHVAARDVAQNRRWGIAPSASFGIAGADTFTVAYLHQHENNVPDPGIPFLFGASANVPRDAYYGLATDSTSSNVDIATALYRHEFDETIAVFNTLRHAHYQFGYFDDMPNFGADVPLPGTPLSGILVGRDAPSSSGAQSNWTDQFDLTARFQSGFITHLLTTGVEYTLQTNDLDRYVNPFNSNSNWVAETPLLDPDPYEVHAAQPLSSIQDTVAHAQGVYISDTIGLCSQFDLLAGGRYDRFSASYRQYTVGSGVTLDLSHIDSLFSPRAALIYKPTSTQNYYLSYGTSFDPSAEALTLTTRTANLGPVKAKTYEAGAKLSWMDNQLAATAAIFRTEVDKAQTNDPENPTITTLSGDQRVDGVEVSVFGHVIPQVEIVAGYTYLDGRTQSSGTAADVGRMLQNVAHNAMNLWAEYEFTPDLEVAAGGNWLGRRYADFAESVSIPGYVVWNAMASWHVSSHLQLQVNAFNLFNRFYLDSPYYTSAGENHVVPGPGRSAALSVRLQF